MNENYISSNKISGEGDIKRGEKVNEETKNTLEVMNEERPPDRKICRMNIRLLPLKLHFMLFFAGIASIVPYLPLFATQLGLSATGIGFVYFAIPVVSVIAKPLFGWLADRFRRMKLLVGIMTLTIISFYLSLIFIPPLKEESFITLDVGCNINQMVVRQPNISCSSGTNRTKSCQTKCTKCIILNATINCSELINNEELKMNVIVTDNTMFTVGNSSYITCHQSLTYHCEISCPCDEWCCDLRRQYMSLQFWCFFIFNVFGGMARRVIHSLSDSLCYEMLGGKTRNYGKQRLWGSIGRSVSPAVTGYLLDYTKHGNEYNYAVAIYVMAGLLFLDILAVFRLDLSGNKPKVLSEAICKDVMSLFGDCKHIIFAASVTVNGVLCGLYFLFYFLFMQEIGASKFLIGMTVMMRLVSEVPCFFFAGKIIAKLGHFNAVIISFLVFSARFFSYVYIHNPQWMLLAEISHGFTFGFFYAAMTSYAKHCAPTGTEATFQGLLGALFDGVGMAIGNILGGLGFDHYGSRATFLIASITSLISAIMTFVLHSYSIYKRKSIEEKKEKQQSEEIEAAYDEFDNML